MNCVRLCSLLIGAFEDEPVPDSDLDFTESSLELGVEDELRSDEFESFWFNISRFRCNLPFIVSIQLLILVPSPPATSPLQSFQSKFLWGCVEGDALDLPFSDCYFEAIMMGYGLCNVVAKYKALKEVYIVSKTGSKASILYFNETTDEFRTSIQYYVMPCKFHFLNIP